MRPTLLNFRSPKEKTPFYFEPKITYDGRVLSFNSPKGSGKTSSFSYEKRFSWYKNLKGTSYPVGPGTYSPLCMRSGKASIRSGSPYKKLHALIDDSSKGHLMVGDQIVYDSEYQISIRQKASVDSENSLFSKESSLERKRTNDNSRRFTPDPIYKIKQDYKNLKKIKKPLTLINLQKNYKLCRIERILKNRFKSSQ